MAYYKEHRTRNKGKGSAGWAPASPPPEIKNTGRHPQTPGRRHLVKAAARATSGRSGGQTWFRADTGERVAGG